MDSKVPVNIINTNARSLRPKIASFIECFLSLALTFAIVTETWFAHGTALELESERLLLGHGLGLLCLNRPPVNGLSHGGVAIIYRASTTKLQVYKFQNPDNFEVLTCMAKVTGIERKFFLTAAYIPPGYSVPRGKACMQHIADIILEIKRKFVDPLLLVAGDFNQWDVADKLSEYPDMEEVPSPPTLADRKIDKIFINWSEEVHESGCLPPLESDLDGELRTYSDHRIQYACARLLRKDPVQWETFTYRPFTEKGKGAFVADIALTDWSPVSGAVGSNKKAEKLQEILDRLMGLHFPLKTIKRKDSDLPRINDTALGMIKKKNAIYKSEGKSNRWEHQRARVETYLEERRISFLQSQREKFTGPQASTNFFANVRAFKNAEKPKSFNVRDLRPGAKDGDIAAEVAAYFNRISNEFKPLEPSHIPMTYHRELRQLEVHEVKDMLIKAKKTKSRVGGDIFPSTINDCAAILAVPLTDIFNSILATYVWPLSWKKEYVTTIPKKSIPEDLSDLRNISCTVFFSKVFEGHVLKLLKEETSLKENQYGGTQGCSTTHMVVAILQEICSNAEDYRSATVISTIDFSKAFNRVSYQHCLEALRRKGASTPVIRLVASFLTNRTMTVRVGDCWSPPLEVNGGCPQGSVLGVRLFNSTTDDLEDDFLHHERSRLGTPSVTPPPNYPTPTLPTNDAPDTSSPEGNHTVRIHLQFSPISGGGFRWGDRNIEFRPNVANVPVPSVVMAPTPDEVPVGTQVLTRKPVLVFKYIDDILTCEKVNFGNVPIVVNNGEAIKTKLAVNTQNGFQCISTNSRKMGMIVNSSKTGLLCVSDSMSYKAEAFIVDGDGTRINSVDSLKVLGFTFSSKPTVGEHVDSVCKRIRQRTWALRHLSKTGFTQTELVQVYTSLILPIADYCAPAYHSLTTDIQDQLLERAQTGALRAIYGYGRSARQLRQEAGLSTLRERRIEATDKFAYKCLSNPRFCKWFPKKTNRTSARNKEEYLEEFAKCERLKNSPIFYMRRRLNGKEGRTYGERNRIYRENFTYT